MLHSLEKLGNKFYGVANIPLDFSEKKLDELAKSNIVAVRFNLRRGGSASVKNLEKLSNSLFEKYGWHTELYIDSTDLRELKPILKKIPQFSIDHLGLSKDGLPELYYWAEKGTKIKATGFGRIDFDPISAMRRIYDINPESLMFGTDLPSTRAKIPFSENDLVLIKDNFNETEQENILLTNGRNWYEKSTLK